MRRTSFRSAATVGGLAVTCAAALAVATPAHAHDQPAPGFNAVLHDPHHGKTATEAPWPDCDLVVDEIGTDLLRRAGNGYDTWIFYIPEGSFDASGPVAEVRFDDTGGQPRTVAVPGDRNHAYWVLPRGGSHLAVAVPAGWTLVDADFAVVDSPYRVEVERTCPDASAAGTDAASANEGDQSVEGTSPGDDAQPDDGNDAGGGRVPDADGEPEGATAEDATGDDQRSGGLAVTGAHVGGMLIVGVGMLAAGFAMTAVKRRRDLSRLLDN